LEKPPLAKKRKKRKGLLQNGEYYKKSWQRALRKTNKCTIAEAGEKLKRSIPNSQEKGKKGKGGWGRQEWGNI